VEEKHLANLNDRTAVPHRQQVPATLHGCHTALMEGYIIEGHVPADVLTRLLQERPAIVGLAVPGMPVGSPGMEIPGHPAEHYNILAFDRHGKTDIFASR
jgi:hypothetical protein